MAISDAINVTLHGDREVKEKLRQLGLRALPAGAQSLFESAENIMTISKDQYVPVETGTLKASGFVRPPETRRSTVTVTLGYGGAAQGYALAVHENPRAGKTGGVSPSGKKYKRWAQVGEWKYLQTPVQNNAGNVVDKLKRDLARELARI
jgi:hypothetical protein